VLPDVPTIAEAGVPGFEAVGWTLVSVPAATPKPIVDRLSAELAAAAAQPKTDHRGSAEYKRHMVSVFVKRILVAENGTAAGTSTERAA